MSRKAFLRECSAAALVELLGGETDAQQLAAVLAAAPALAALLAAPPRTASPESLLLALRLWHVLPAATLKSCALLPALPAGSAPPPPAFWDAPASVPRSAVAPAAAALFTPSHVGKLTPVLLASSGSHPRLHPVWGCLMALLVPGFSPLKVGVIRALHTALCY